MGAQQLLLVVLGMVIIGIALTVAVTAFQANAAEHGRSALINDMMGFASNARAYYWKPLNFGGGAMNFMNIHMVDVTARPENVNGRYFIESVAAKEMILVGVGRVVSGEDTIRVRMRVNERTSKIEIVN